jgi:ABC-type lipoprotein export system ATPase subunit
MVTHDRQIAGLSDRIIELRDGVIYNEELQS